MAFTSPMTAVTGVTFTAAQFNTNVRDNLNAIWVGTTAGDVEYYSSATAKARVALGANGSIMYVTSSAPAWLAVGTENQVLKVTSGTPAPVWANMFQICSVYRSSNQATTSGVAADINWDAELLDDQNWHSTVSNTNRITVSATTGYYVPFVTIRWVKDSGGAGTHAISAFVQKNGTTTTANRFSDDGFVVSANPKEFTFGGIPLQLSASDYVTVNFLQNSGGTGQITGGGVGESSFVLYRFR